MENMLIEIKSYFLLLLPSFSFCMGVLDEVMEVKEARVSRMKILSLAM